MWKEKRAAPNSLRDGSLGSKTAGRALATARPMPSGIAWPTLAACGRRGVKHAIVISGGFREIGEKGEELERDMMTIAREYGIRLLGPNCIGVTNPHNQMNTTTFPYAAPSGYMGMVSQSGSFIAQMFTYLSKMGLGFSTAFSVGNEADID